ncbi:MAG: hypothetical protein KBT27_01935 [Prevotellaceae bacterium]|nr:hypothetical protein [Candidatus Faecinaster equi]
MFHLATFTFGIIAIAFVISIVAFVLLLLFVNLFKTNASHTPLSICIAVCIVLVLLVFNSVFMGLVRSKNLLEAYQHSSEYKLIQKGESLLSSVSPELFELVDSIYGEECSTQQIEYQKQQINKYLWIDGCLCVIVFLIGVWATMSLCKKRHIRTSQFDDELVGYEENESSIKYYEY